jgi:nucleoside 2-deoxyribosyltransferase
MSNSLKQNVYLAGPDVFLRNAKERGEELKAICAKYGFNGLYPLDGETDSKPEFLARDIFKANIKLINSAKFVLANVTPFRGPSLDAGTAFEIGYAVAKGIPVYSYTNSNLSEYKDRVIPDEYSVEDFGLSENLMIACSTIVFASPEDALDYIATVYSDD